MPKKHFLIINKVVRKPTSLVYSGILFVLLQKSKALLFVFFQVASMLFMISCSTKVVKCMFEVVK